MTTTMLYLNREDEFLDLEISADIDEGESSITTGSPDRWRPAGQFSIDIHSILMDGEEWNGKLTAEEYKMAEEKLLEQNQIDIDNYEPDFDDEPEVDWNSSREVVW